jgi:D-inositol-3-phosphate glycosyltransferase
MLKLAHMIETIELGGVLRNLETLMAHMGDVEHIRYDVSPRRQLPPIVPADQIVVIHFTASWSKLPFLATLRAMRGNAPIVIVEHSYTDCYEKYVIPSKTRFRSMLKLVYGMADRVVAVSHGQGAWLRNLGVVDPAKVVVIPSSTYCGGYLDIPAPLDSRERNGPMKIAAYGRYHEQKGFGNLIHAMRQVSPGVAHLTLAGLGPYTERLTALAAHMPHVTVGGPTSDVTGFLRACDVVAVPSRWESFGQVALEARAAARPIICSAVDGLVEQTAKDCGWLIAEDDVPALVRVIHEAAAADLTVMGNAARVSADGHLTASLNTWRKLAGELSSVKPQVTTKAAARSAA